MKTYTLCLYLMGEPALVRRLVYYIFFLLLYAFEKIKRELSFVKKTLDKRCWQEYYVNKILLKKIL